MNYRSLIFIIVCSLTHFLASAQQCLDPLACNFNTDENCRFIDGPCDDGNQFTVSDIVNDNCNCVGEYLVTLDLFDDGGNGYSGTLIGIRDFSDGTLYGPYTMEDGFTESFTIPLPPGCYEIFSSDDALPDEVSYYLSTTNGFNAEDVFGIPGQTQTFSVGGISGCTDPTAVNFDPMATCEAGTCYICDVDGECEIGTDGFLKPKPCNELELCGPGFYIIIGLESGFLTDETDCVTVPIPDKVGDYDVRVIPFGGSMVLSYEDEKVASSVTCFQIDENGCNSHEYNWKTAKSGFLTMEDDCGLGWDGISYELCDSDFNIIESGSLSDSSFGDNTSLGYDSFDLEDGCYVLKFKADDCFYPCQEFSLDYIDEAEISGIVNSDPVYFTINSEACLYGCTDLAALNFDILATHSCLGDNSCCLYKPVNDICDNAAILQAGISQFWDTEYATLPEFQCSSVVSKDVWFKYSPSCDANLTLSGFSANNFVVSIYQDVCPTSTDEQIFCPDFPLDFLVNIPVNALTGAEYYFQVSTDSFNQFGNGSIKIEDNGCRGCTDSNADNYNPTATIDDGSCICNSCPGDFTGDGFINIADLTGFLSVFGSSCIPD